jgi:hypothetical protein
MPRKTSGYIQIASMEFIIVFMSPQSEKLCAR